MYRMNLTLHFQLANAEIAPRPINVRRSLVVANLIEIVKNKLNLVGNYELRWMDFPQALDSRRRLDELGALEGSELVYVAVHEVSDTLELIARGVRAQLERSFKRVYLMEQRMLREYELQWQPAIIGRRNRQNPNNNRLLAVDLDGLEDPPTVSRHHACITERGGSFFIESINEQNPTYLDDVRLQPGAQALLRAGSTIEVGKVRLQFNLIE